MLDAEGWLVFDAAEVAARLPEPLVGCAPGEGCAFELRAVLGADLWPSGSRSRARATRSSGSPCR
ncbi:MAG: hypothetical protein M5U28_13075 [Sandaracinaceae bacterium]|nr:hypothetical protein [Sandaracinaceae bacterium]